MTLSTKGDVTLEPLHVKSSIKHVHKNLERYQPYISPHVNATLKKANVSSTAKLELKMLPKKTFATPCSRG